MDEFALSVEFLLISVVQGGALVAIQTVFSLYVLLTSFKSYKKRSRLLIEASS